MINSFNHYLKSIVNFFTKKDSKIQTNSEKDLAKNSHFYPFSTKEWLSSMYSYNKASSKPLVATNFVLNILLKSYFNILQLKRKFLNRRRDNKLRYSANQNFISKVELEHTNSKLLLTLTTYNKKKELVERELRKFIMLVKFWKTVRATQTMYRPDYKNRLLHVVKRNFYIFNKWNIAFFKEKTSLFDYLLKTKWRNFNFYDYVPIMKKSRAAHLHNFYNIPNHYNKRLKKLFKLEKTLFNYTKTIHFMIFLSTNVGLSLRNLGLIRLLEKLYGKKIKIHLVESRSVHLNSDVFSAAVALKLRDRKNKVVSILRKAVLQMVNIPDLHTLITFDDSAETLNKNNVVNNMKQQVVSGVRFEASGRLTRRLTAMRAVFKYRYAGSLKNIRSSFNNESSTMLRGYLKSNLQHSLINSKTRNGTFGLKGWISSHIVNSLDFLSILSDFFFISELFDLDLSDNTVKFSPLHPGSIIAFADTRRFMQMDMNRTTGVQTSDFIRNCGNSPIAVAIKTREELEKLSTLEKTHMEKIAEERGKHPQHNEVLDRWQYEWANFCKEQKTTLVQRNNTAIDKINDDNDYLNRDLFAEQCKLDENLSLQDLINSIILPIFMISDVPILSVLSMLFKYYRETRCFWDGYFIEKKLQYKSKLTTILSKLKK